MNFRQGDLAGFEKLRVDFTPEGWKDFLRHMEGFLDENGAPTFTSSFVARRDATILDEKDGVLHLRIPGTLTQTSTQMARTTYGRAALDIYVLTIRTAAHKVQIQRLKPITCAENSTACD